VVAQPQKEVVADTGSTPAVNVAPVPASKPAQLQKAPVKAPPDAVTDAPPPKKVTVKTPPPDDTKADPKPEARTADKVAELLNEMDSRGATTGSGGSPTLGKASGGEATLTQSMIDMLSAAMLKCFNPPIGAIEEGASAVVEVRLTRDGLVDGDPTVVSTVGPTTGSMTGTAAVRAVVRCGQNGYTMLPPNLYDGDNGWNTVRVTFNASDAATAG
jgi:colicin import membrane protein